MRGRLIMLVAAAAVIAGCGGGGDGRKLRRDESRVATPGGVVVEVQDADLRRDAAFALAVQEIDAVADRFAVGVRPYELLLRGVRIVGHGEAAANMRARHVGDGWIEACVHEDQRPVIFCLPGAFDAMAVAQGIPRSLAERARIDAQARLTEMYPGAVTVD